jgi:hypothetical protein
LSAPAIFLPRLLLCSGLPRSSLITMIDRLGRLGDASDNMNALYARLLVPSASSEWDVSRIGSKRDVARQLLGRLSAYIRVYQIPSNNQSVNISTSFLFWLSDECKSTPIEAPNKGRLKKAKVVTTNTLLSSTGSACSVLAILRDEGMRLPIIDKLPTCECTDSKFKLQELRSPQILNFDLSDDASRGYIKSCVIENQMSILEDYLQEYYSKILRLTFDMRSSSKSQALNLAVQLLEVYHSFGSSSDTTVLHTWLPRLTRNEGSPELWKLMFEVSCSDSVLLKCMTSWTNLHVTKCKDWILSQSTEQNVSFDFGKFALFLASTSGQSCSPMEQFSKPMTTHSGSAWAGTKDFVVAGTTIAIRSIRQLPESKTSALCRRNSLLPGLTLCVLISKCGKKQFRSVCDVVLSELASTDNGNVAMKSALEVLLLRLYLFFPHWMDLGTAAARKALMNASEENAHLWSDWKSHFDDRIDSLLDVVQVGEFGMAKALVEMSRKQPLLILRKLPTISALLYANAKTSANFMDNRKDQRGIVEGQHISGSIVVPMRGNSVKLSFHHWGYTFLEPLWMMVLDVLLAMPHEVLYSCGTKLGLFDCLMLYLELLSVQRHLNSAREVERMKVKLGNIVIAFQKYNMERWQEWMSMFKEDDEIRNILLKLQ